MDGKYDLVAGVMSINENISKLSCLGQLINKDRIYKSYKEMAYKESFLKDKIDVVVILTPPNFHIEIAKEIKIANVPMIIPMIETQPFNLLGPDPEPPNINFFAINNSNLIRISLHQLVQYLLRFLQANNLPIEKKLYP